MWKEPKEEMKKAEEKEKQVSVRDTWSSKYFKELLKADERSVREMKKAGTGSSKIKCYP